MAEFREYYETDWQQVADNLRDSDIEECRILYPNDNAVTLLEDSVTYSDTLRTFADGNTVLAVCGVVETPSGPAVWLLGSNELDRLVYRKAILRQAPDLLKEWLDRYEYLWNWCSDEAIRVKMLRHLGFTVYESDNKGRRLLELCV